MVLWAGGLAPPSRGPLAGKRMQGCKLRPLVSLVSRQVSFQLASRTKRPLLLRLRDGTAKPQINDIVENANADQVSHGEYNQ